MKLDKKALLLAPVSSRQQIDARDPLATHAVPAAIRNHLALGNLLDRVDFQNRVLKRYADSRGVPFIDVAGALPQDPNLFVDAIHMTDPGERVKAWIVFQPLAPLLRAQIESGQFPRQASQHLPKPPSLNATKMSTHCDATPPHNQQ